MSESQKNMVQHPMNPLRSFTDARIALGRTGVSMPTTENLVFKMAHANARDAVHVCLSVEQISGVLVQLNQPFLSLHSQATDRSMYLLRPDLGRKLNETSIAELKEVIRGVRFDMNIIVADGLSALAVHKNLEGFLTVFLPQLKKLALTVSPIFLVEQGRVAISDEIGALCASKLSIIILGERPGLSSPDSLGIYLTYAPAVGNTDDKRNCISNIRAGGLSYEEATKKLIYLMNEALHLKLSGVALKDNEKSILLNKINS